MYQHAHLLRYDCHAVEFVHVLGGSRRNIFDFVKSKCFRTCVCKRQLVCQLVVIRYFVVDIDKLLILSSLMEDLKL